MKLDNDYGVLCGDFKDFNSHTGMLDEWVDIDCARLIDEQDEIVLDTKDIIEKSLDNVMWANTDQCRKDIYGENFIDLFM